MAQPPRYIALLRAINVGGHTVKMDQLRKLFETLGLANVETFIASGNVIFDAPAEDTRTLEKRIERHLQQSLGYEVITFIRSAPELAAVATYQPFAAAELAEASNSLYVAFLTDQPGDTAQQKLMAFRNEIDDFHIHKREAYWLCRRKMNGSVFSGALLEKTLGVPATMRNVTTIKKLAAKYAADL